MKKIYKSNSGFTLIELLAVVVVLGIILGISIAAVMHFIDKARKEQIASQEKTLIIAAKNYLQENRGLLPKSIGETTVIPINVLKVNNYITENIKNSKKESCMENSYVTAYKESQTKYSYKAYIYCGSETGTVTVASSTPTIKIDFVDSNGTSIKNDPSILEKVSEAKFIIDFGGGTKDGKSVAIDGYSYSILVKVNGESSLREVYSSGTLSANHATSIHVDRDNNLGDYIDISGQTTVAIKATVRNIDGGVNDQVEFVGGESEQAEVVYHDRTAPTCVAGQTIGEAAENDWINTNSASRERKITVVCKDGSGSGCVRSSFTKTWNGSEGFEYDNIQIKDNAGNTKNCRVRVNVDKAYPIINITAYAKGKTDGSTIGSNTLIGTSSNTSATNGSVTINSNEYTNLYSGYMNKLKYPNGVIYKINISDGVGLKNWSWEVNEPGITSVSDSGYETVSATNEAKTGSCLNEKECSFDVNLYSNGLRKGVLTVYDKAGNKSMYTIYANINRMAPDAPIIVNSSSGDEKGEWTRSNVTLDLRTANFAAPISEYYYSYNKNADEFSNNDLDVATKWVKMYGGTGQASFTTEPWTTEINKKIYIIVCDQAENCSDPSDTMIRIDRTAPTGIHLTGYKKVSSDNLTSATGLRTISSDTWYSGWIIVIPDGASDTGSKGINYKVTVTGASENVEDSIQDYRNVNAEGTSIVSFKACDKLDNCSRPVSFIAKLDRTGPTMPTISNPTGGNWTTESVTLTIGTTAVGASLEKYYYSYNSTASERGTNPTSQWVEMTEGTSQDSFTKTWSDDRNETVYIQACDILDNCSSINNTIIRIDNHPPSQPVITNPTNGEWAKDNFSLTLVSFDAGSGLADYQYTYNANATDVGDNADTQWKSNGLPATETYITTPFSVERNQNVYWRVCDGLGNCSTKSSTRIKLDKTEPTCGNITTTQNDSEGGVAGSIACSDGFGECKSGSFNFGPLTVSDSVKIEDKAGNEKLCPIGIRERDCSTYAAWQFLSLYSNTNNNCPADTNAWDYDFGNCSDNYQSDTCGNKCAERCTGGLANCRYVCCIKRRRTAKTCYLLNQ